MECGATEELEVHHRDKNRWNNSLENLAVVCEECHDKIHSEDPEMAHWREEFNSTPPGGEVTTEEVAKAFKDTDL